MSQDITELLSKMSVEEKKTLLNQLNQDEQLDYKNLTYSDFGKSEGRSHNEIKEFNSWRKYFIDKGLYSVETKRLTSSKSTIEIKRETGEKYKVLNFANFDYLGYSNHPEAIKAAKAALDKYGIGAAATPIVSGTLDLHSQLEEALLEFYGLEGYGITLFSSGFGTLVGTISGYLKDTDHILLDGVAHASIVDGAVLSGAQIHYFDHNDMEELEEILEDINDGKNRLLICSEGVFSADGDFGDLRNIVKLAKKYGAKTLVDEAHSILAAGETGRGVCEELGVLGEIDFIAGTLSKGFGGVGGYLFAKKEITNYINVFARNRMFSTSLDPAVTGGLIGVVKQAMKPESKELRKKLHENAALFRSLVKDYVDIGNCISWIVPVIYGSEKMTFELADFLQKEGFEGSMMTYPGVAKNRARIRVFISSKHDKKDMEKGAEIVLKAAKKFGFLKKPVSS